MDFVHFDEHIEIAVEQFFATDIQGNDVGAEFGFVGIIQPAFVRKSFVERSFGDGM